MLTTKFRFTWHSCFREKDFEKQELPVAAMFAYRTGWNEQF